MADRITVKVEGLAGVADALRNLEPKISRNLLRKALKAVGLMWVDEVKSRVPVLLGDLKESIASKVQTRKAKSSTSGLPSGSVDVGPGMAARTDGKKSVGPGIYGMWVEFGLRAKQYAMHPFLRPTFDSTGDRAVQVFADTLKDGLADAIKED